MTDPERHVDTSNKSLPNQSSSPSKGDNTGGGDTNADLLAALVDMKPAAPSEEFERRMAALFDEVQPSPAIWRRQIAAWQAVAACFLCGLGGFGASRYFQETVLVPQPETRTEYYIIPPASPIVRSAFDLTDPAPFREAASPPIQVVIQTADWDQQS